MTWDKEQVIALAPDSASVKAAQKLTKVAKWPLLEYNQRAVWGHCQGSGKKPYLTRIDLAEPAFKCSCPSRKFPCKHSLALFVLYVENQADFTSIDECPDWVAEWLDGRDDRKEKKAAKAANPKPVDEKAQAKRQLDRTEKVAQGITELKRWLEDILQVGLADLPNKTFAYWQDLAARMVDSQASGLANRVKTLGSIAMSGRDVMPGLTESIGQLNLLLEAYSRIDTLPPLLQADVRQQIGWSQSQDELLVQSGVQDKWLVLGVHRQTEDNLISQTCWLYGLNEQRPACIIQFAHTSQLANLTNGWRVQTIVEGNLHFYPSATPLRAIVGTHEIAPSSPNIQPTGCEPLDATVEAYHQLRHQNPWLATYPFCIEKVRFVHDNGSWFVVDENDTEFGLPVTDSGSDVWRLMTVAGGAVVKAAVEFDGQYIRPLGVWVDDEYHSVLSKEGSS